MVLVAESEDKSLHTVLTSFLGERKMAALESSELAQLIAQAVVPTGHPINGLAMQEDLEDAALGGAQGIEKLQSAPSSRRISPDDLKQARENADRTGREGEEYIFFYLSQLKQRNEIRDFEWASSVNAIAPYDFKVINNDGSQVLIDVKTTRGKFDNPIHISLNELRQMNYASGRYDLYRVFEVEDGSAQLRVAENLGGLAREILSILSNLPSGILPDSVSLDPKVLLFGKNTELVTATGPEDTRDESSSTLVEM